MREYKRITAALITAMTFFLSSCSNDHNDDPDPDPKPLSLNLVFKNKAIAETDYAIGILYDGYPVPDISTSGLPGWMYLDGSSSVCGIPPSSAIGLNFSFSIIATNDNERIYQSVSISVVETEEYLIIDLTNYQISYETSIPDLLLNDKYRTTHLVLKLIPGGSFMMGDQVGGHDYYEIPVHPVNITSDFYIGVFEFTQRQWYELTGEWPSYFTTNPDKRPLEYVIWPDVKNVLADLSTSTGLNCSLPTEAQWEYACKAGTYTNYCFGNEIDSDYVWYVSNTTGETNETGLKLPNNWGLYDMYGNVNELCNDWYGSLYYQKCIDDLILNDPLGPDNPDYSNSIILRGGDYIGHAYGCRSSFRTGESFTYSMKNGFRVVVNK